MCLGVPLRLIAVDGIVGRALNGPDEELVDLSLEPDARPGDWVLSFLGAARGILQESEALAIRAALRGLASVMAGGPAGAAFADLDSRSPTLPPHLQAALDAGHTTG